MGKTPDNSLPRPLASYLPRVEALLRDVIRLGGFDLDFAVRRAATLPAALETPEYVVEFSGGDTDTLLERNGALLDALEYAVLKAVRLEEDLFGEITFDCNGWRQTRALELMLTAQVAAERVRETGEPFPLGAMSPRERRIVHLALRGQPHVRTVSEGVGASRHVVIRPSSTPTRSPGR